MARDGEEGEEDNQPELQRSSSTESQSQPQIRLSADDIALRPKPDPFLIVCGCFSVVTALSAVLCIVVNVFSAIRTFKRIEDGSDVFDGIFRCYAVVLAVFVVIAETEWSLVFKLCQVCSSFKTQLVLLDMIRVAKVLEKDTICDTLIAGFNVAIMTRAFPDYSGQRKDLVLFHDVASYLLLVCGAAYLISGILCIGYLKRARARKQMTRDQAVKDLEELERRRQELESLLIRNTV
ncbi:hypothetical protein Cgig2_019451 [Carnegiea gigantea]|uniref:Uncharacterized protein n=1 Tax=Carnegiea gigantea TaxID=171969 RepID=A0A9Q1KQB8_9CARY|nr:hypothetical protein Cgig2_019451 [Carnegiea gigantea]